jgi:hypothetical protein
MVKNKKLIISMSTVLLIVLFGVGSFFGLKAYEKQQEDKIYSTGDVVKFPDFEFKVTKAEFKPVDLPVDQETVAKYGSLDKPENCETMSKENTMAFFGSPEPMPYGPSDYNICIRRNDSRKGINEYMANNKQLVVDYSITAKSNVNTDNLNIELIPDSGRKLNERVNTFNGTQFFNDSAQEKTEFGGVIIYSSEVEQKYIPYKQSDIGGNINKGLKRTGYTYTDIRNTENSVDIKVTYNKDGKAHTRIIRVEQ